MESKVATWAGRRDGSMSPMQHQNCEGANHTKKRLPVKLLYFEESDRIDVAFYREKQVQGWSRRKKEALIKGEHHKLPELSRNLPSTSSGNGPSTSSGDGPSTGSGNGPSTSAGDGPSTGSVDG